MSIENMTDEQREAAQARRRELAAMTPQQRIDDAGLVFKPKRRALVARRLADMPPSYRSNYLTALKGNSPTSAIKAHCRECMGYSSAEVGRCTAQACSFYGYRPNADA